MQGWMNKATVSRRRLALAAIIAVCAPAATAQPVIFENLDLLETHIGAFTGPDRTPRVDRRLKLGACAVRPELVWYGTGQTTVLVRCGGPNGWQIYVPVHMNPAGQGAVQGAVQGGSVVVVRPVPRGGTITAGDVDFRPDTYVPGGVTAVDQVVGKVVIRALNPGEAVRANMLIAANAVKRGDPVQIKSGGTGIEVAVEGVAEQDAPVGGRVRVRNVVSGSRMQAIVVGPGIVALPGYKNPEDGRE